MEPRPIFVPPSGFPEPSTHANSWLAAAMGTEYPSHHSLSSSVDSTDPDEADADIANSVARMALASSSSSTPELDQKQEEITAHKKGVWRILPIDQSRFASAGYDGVVKVWNIAHSERGPQTLQLKKNTKNRSEALSLALLDPNTLLAGNAQGFLNIWNTGSFASKGFVKDEKRSNTGFYSAASLGNNRVATGSCQKPKNVAGNWQHAIKVWDLSPPASYEGMKPVATLTGHAGGISNIVSINQTNFASSSGDKMIRIWDATTLKTSSILQGHTEYVYGLCKIDDASLLSGSKDTTARVWDLRSNSESSRLQMKDALGAHASTIYDVAAYGENQLLTCSRDGYVKLWDRRSPAQVIETFDTGGQFVYTAKKVGDATIVAGTGNGAIHTWNHK